MMDAEERIEKQRKTTDSGGNDRKELWAKTKYENFEEENNKRLMAHKKKKREKRNGHTY